MRSVSVPAGGRALFTLHAQTARPRAGNEIDDGHEPEHRMWLAWDLRTVRARDYGEIMEDSLTMSAGAPTLPPNIRRVTAWNWR